MVMRTIEDLVVNYQLREVCRSGLAFSESPSATHVLATKSLQAPRGTMLFTMT